MDISITFIRGDLAPIFIRHVRNMSIKILTQMALAIRHVRNMCLAPTSTNIQKNINNLNHTFILMSLSNTILHHCTPNKHGQMELEMRLPSCIKTKHLHIHIG